MTTPDVPYRFEHSVEVPGTPEQVWAAIATANGISSWFIPTDLEEHEGGVVEFHMGPDQSSRGEVTAFDAPKRFAYSEPDWAALAGHPDASVTPMATEFIVEATAGGTCVVRVVSSAFGTGADWEQEFWDLAIGGWAPMFDGLQVYLTHFAGQQVTTMDVMVTVPGDRAAVWSALRAALGAEQIGQVVDARGAVGTLERLDSEHLLVRLGEPVPGFLLFVAPQEADGETVAMLQGHLFSDNAATYVKEEQAGWQAWLEALAR